MRLTLTFVRAPLSTTTVVDVGPPPGDAELAVLRAHSAYSPTGTTAATTPTH